MSHVLIFPHFSPVFSGQPMQSALTVYGKTIAIIWRRAKTANVWLQDLYFHLFHTRYSCIWSQCKQVAIVATKKTKKKISTALGFITERKGWGSGAQGAILGLWYFRVLAWAVGSSAPTRSQAQAPHAWADGLMGLSRRLCSINNVFWPIDRVSRSGSFSSYHLSATLQSFGSQI